MECQQCSVGWQLLEHDRFCGFCGHPTYSLSIHYSPNFLYAGKSQPTLTVFVVNNGSFPLHLLAVSPPACWKLETPFNEDFLQPQERRSIRLKQTQPLDPQTENQLRIRVQELQETVSKNIPVSLLPKLVVEGEPLRFGLQTETNEKQQTNENNANENTEEARYTVSWKVEAGSFELLDLSSKDTWWTISEPLKKKTYLIGESISVPIQLRPGQLRRQTRLEGQALFHLGSSHEALTLEAGFSLIVQAKPEISIRDLPPPSYVYEYPSHLEKSPVLDLLVRVQGEKGFSILSLEHQASDQRPAFQPLYSLPTTSKPSDKKAKSEAKPAEETTWEVQLPFRLVRAERKLPTSYDLKLTLRCEPYGVIHKIFHVNFAAPKQLLVGVDFGTTNTCAAYLSLNDKDPQITLHQPQDTDEELLPTVLFYHGFQEETDKMSPFVYEIGTQAKTRQAKSLKKVEFFNFIRSIKRKLGTHQKTYLRFSHIENTHHRLPKEIVQDFFKELLDEVSRIGIVRHLFITHPTRFSELQVQELREAVRNSGYPNPNLLDEASAAAYFYINQQIKTAKEEDEKKQSQELDRIFAKEFKLVVYDFGGGTTDITASKIGFDTEKDRLVIQSIAAGGIKDLGGEDVTEQIIQKILLPQIRKKIGTQLNRQLRHAESIEIPYRSPTESELLENNELRLQSISLYEIAEDLKKSLSQKETYKSPNRTSSFFYKDHHGILQKSTDFDWELTLSRTELNESIRELLLRGVKHLKQMLEGYRLSLTERDLLLLAGQSSRIPLLREMMREELPVCRIELLPLDELKRCVAAGACAYGQIFLGIDSESLEVQSFSKVTRFSYAILRRNPLRGVVLHELISQFSPLGCEYKIPPLPTGTLVEIYQNATPWIKDPKTADADRIGSFFVGQEIFEQIDPKECEWFIEIDLFERIFLVIRKKDGFRVVWESRFECKTIAY